MKKLFLLLLLSASAGILCAEQLQFVTVLSNPVGTFKEVKVLSENDASATEPSVYIKDFTFGVQWDQVGTITVNPLKVDKLLVGSGTNMEIGAASLIDNGNAFSVVSTNMHIGSTSVSGVDFYGGKLSAQRVKTGRVRVESTFTAEKNIGTSVDTAVKDADFNTMYINNTAQLTQTASQTGASSSSLGWKACGTGVYLLADGDLNCTEGDSGSGGVETLRSYWQVYGTYLIGSVSVFCGDVPDCQDGSPQGLARAQEAALWKCANMVNTDPALCKSAVGVSCNAGMQSTCIVKDSYYVRSGSSGFAGATHDCFAQKLVCKP